jgi:ferredoxin-NADP reductase
MTAAPALLGALPERPRLRAQLPANATLVGRELVTDDIHVLRIRPDDGPVSFQPGQYLSLGLWHDGGWLQRPYSPAGRPDDRELELLVRRVANGSLTPLLWSAAAGTRVRIGPAKGLFRLVPDDMRQHLFLATGTGIAPMVAMVSALLQRADPPPIVVVHGVRHISELAFRERIEGWISRIPELVYIPAASRCDASAAAGIHRARALDLLPDVWVDHVTQPDGVVAYLCGNPAVVDAAARWLAARGLAPDAVRCEEYWSPTAPGVMA